MSLLSTRFINDLLGISCGEGEAVQDRMRVDCSTQALRAYPIATEIQAARFGTVEKSNWWA